MRQYHTLTLRGRMGSGGGGGREWVLGGKNGFFGHGEGEEWGGGGEWVFVRGEEGRFPVSHPPPY